LIVSVILVFEGPRISSIMSASGSLCTGLPFSREDYVACLNTALEVGVVHSADHLEEPILRDDFDANAGESPVGIRLHLPNSSAVM
jgi:hypothetical protein